MINRATAIAVCETEDCENFDIPIELTVYWSDDEETPTVICGPCATPISDVVVGDVEIVNI